MLAPIVRALLVAAIMTLPVAGTAAGSDRAGSPDLPQRLAGTWVGNGRVAGSDVKARLVWDIVLGGQFLRIQYRFDPVGSGATPFEGHGYYRADTANVWRGGWYDTQRAMHTLSGHIEGDSLVALWGAEGAPHGRTVYRVLSSNKMEVTDSIRGKDGVWREFGRVMYNR